MARTSMRDRFLALAKQGVFPGRKNVRPTAKKALVKVRYSKPPYKGEYEVKSITLGKDTVQVPYRSSIRNFPFEDVSIVST